MSARKREYLKFEALEDTRNASKQEDEGLKRLMLDGAIRKYREYLGFEENQNDDDAWAGLGGAYRRNANVDQAIESYGRAYQLNDASTYALVNLVSLMAARRRAEDEQQLQEYAARADDRLRAKIKNGGDDHWTWYDVATLELIQGKTAESIPTFEYAIARTPEGARENFASVLSNLKFLQSGNPNMPGIAEAIRLVEPHAQAS